MNKMISEYIRGLGLVRGRTEKLCGLRKQFSSSDGADRIEEGAA